MNMYLVIIDDEVRYLVYTEAEAQVKADALGYDAEIFEIKADEVRRQR